MHSACVRWGVNECFLCNYVVLLSLSSDVEQFHKYKRKKQTKTPTFCKSKVQCQSSFMYNTTYTTSLHMSNAVLKAVYKAIVRHWNLLVLSRTFIVNTDTCDRGGSHWVAFHFPLVGSKPETYHRRFANVMIVN